MKKKKCTNFTCLFRVYGTQFRWCHRILLLFAVKKGKKNNLTKTITPEGIGEGVSRDVGVYTCVDVLLGRCWCGGGGGLVWTAILYQSQWAGKLGSTGPGACPLFPTPPPSRQPTLGFTSFHVRKAFLYYRLGCLHREGVSFREDHREAFGRVRQRYLTWRLTKQSGPLKWSMAHVISFPLHSRVFVLHR